MLLSLDQFDKTQIELELCFKHLNQLELTQHSLLNQEGELNRSYLQMVQLNLHQISKELNLIELSPALECDIYGQSIAVESLKDGIVKVYRYIVDRIVSLIKFLFGRKGAVEEVNNDARQAARHASGIEKVAAKLSRNNVLNDVQFDFDLTKYGMSDTTIKSLSDALAFASESTGNSIYLLSLFGSYIDKCRAYPTTDLVVFLDEVNAVEHHRRMAQMVDDFLDMHNTLDVNQSSETFRLLGGAEVIVGYRKVPHKMGALVNLDKREEAVGDAIKHFSFKSTGRKVKGTSSFQAKVADFAQISRLLDIRKGIEIKGGNSFEGLMTPISEFLEVLKTLMETYASSRALKDAPDVLLLRDIAIQRSLIQSLISKQLTFSLVKMSVNKTKQLLKQLELDLEKIEKIGNEVDLSLPQTERVAFVEAEWAKYRI